MQGAGKAQVIALACSGGQGTGRVIGLYLSRWGWTVDGAQRHDRCDDIERAYRRIAR
jgi:hypothetical protein